MTNKVLMVIIGIVSIIAGLFCLANPLAGSLASEVIAGWSFLILGIIQAVAAFRETAWKSRIWAILLAVLGILVGISLLASPLEGVFVLTLVVGVLFLVSGVFKVVAGFNFPPGNIKTMIIISGAISALLGFMILSGFPGSAVVTLGVLLGIELITDGAALLAFSFAGRRRI